MPSQATTGQSPSPAFECAAASPDAKASDLMFVDLHTHSNHSDGIPSIDQIEDHCLRSKLVVALTDHNEIRGSIRLSARERMACIPGIEVGTREGLEFLVYFPCPDQLEDYYRTAVEPHLLSRFMVRSKIPSIECLDIARDQGAFVSLAHPFAFGRKSIDFQRSSRKTEHSFVDDVLERVDAVELFNGGVPPGVNRKAAEFLAKIDKPVTVGSDSHRLKTYGSCGMTLHADHSTDCAELFNTLSKAEVHSTEKNHGSVSLTLPVIMFKHTMFFLRAGQHHLWRQK